MGNECLTRAKEAKKDEFYTQLHDIENELRHYTDHFRGKVVYCNCDDPYESNFFRYFILNFNHLGLKKLISTCYAGSPISGKQLCLDAQKIPCGVAHKIEISGVKDLDGNNAFDLNDAKDLLTHGARRATVKKLKKDGDFRSEECIRLLKKADIVVTNPPFSLFREYVAQLIKHNKKFLIIGNKNALTYKEIFPLVKENKIWVGATSMSKDLHFVVPDDYVSERIKDKRMTSLAKEKGKHLGRSPSIWFTNLDLAKRHEDLILFEKYSPEKYPKYDNYDAIEVGQVAKIPCDYDGAMGVPITFLDKYNPAQFEIIGATESEGKGFSNGLWIPSNKVAQPIVGGKKVYKRIFIKKRHLA